jgi:succinate dehydrogenase / fumarate reductase, cytochrome b subunit
MSATTGAVRHPKGEKKPLPTTMAGPFLLTLLESSVVAKILVALTGLGLVGFVIVHLIGNLKLLQGPEAINHYAHFLKHDIGYSIWLARAGLLGIFILHLFLAIRLKLRSVAARPIGYVYPGSAQATLASKTMIWTGIVVGLFVLFHLAHYTFGLVTKVEVSPGKYENYLQLRYKMPDGAEVQDVYSMTVAGFSNPLIACLYLVAMIVLFVHLRHGIPSTFQTLGLKNARFRRAIDILGLAIALSILIGNCGIVLAVWLGLVPPPTR